MFKFVLSGLLLAGLGAACGGSDQPSTTDSGTTRGTGTSTTGGPNTFSASCMIVSNLGGSGETAIKMTVCHDFYNESAADIQASCRSKPGDTAVMSYSADHCPSANLLGTCTPSATGGVDYYYSTDVIAGTPVTKAFYKDPCISSGGTWADP